MPFHYPPAPRGETMDVLHGHRVLDPYRWLEEAEAPATRDWLARQHDLAQAYLKRLPGRDAMAALLEASLAHDQVSVPRPRGEAEFFTRRRANDERDSVWRRGPDGTEDCVLDVGGREGAVLEAWDVSPDGHLIAYQVSARGTEWCTLHVRRLVTGEDAPEAAGTRGGPIAWLPDSSGFYYVHCTPRGAALHRRVMLHRLGTTQAMDRVVFTPDRPGSLKVLLYHGRWLLVDASPGPGAPNGIHLADLADSSPEAPRWCVVQSAGTAVTTAAVGPDDRLYLRTTHGADRGRLCVARSATEGPAHWQEIVPEAPDAVLISFALLGQRGAAPEILVSRLRDAAHELVRYPAPSEPARYGEAQTLLTATGTIAHLSSPTVPADRVGFSYGDYLTPRAPFSYHRTAGVRGTTRQRHTTQRQFRTFYPSVDGTSVPVCVIAPRERSGPRPTLLTCYGGFGIAVTPAYDALLHAWVEAGGICAVASVRGGGEYGAAWHRDGRGARKQNSVDDLNRAAEWLIEAGWTSEHGLGLLGASNAGLLAGAALTQRPELYAAAVCVAPLMDMVRYERFGLGGAWTPEYGSAARPEELRWLLSYSPYQRAAQGRGRAYPSTLLLAHENDTRVDPVHARKMCAALQNATTSDRPVLLRMSSDTGHGRRGRSQDHALATDILSFLAHETGLHGRAVRPGGA
ncbi:prolyl oligopeptidase family serine peptidase [Kitasatospora acidiphila]|uniref:prolyl oligopeptidase family serine peptidase n=1 Tax=Kitasatospora acidiphila TaxID=2567942 RepID=UPI003C721DCA